MDEEPAPNKEQGSLKDIYLLTATPAMDPTITESLFTIPIKAKSKAFFIVTFASGSLPDVYSDHIRKVVNSGIPVFLLSNNPANKGLERGIRKITYQAQIGAIEAGAIPLLHANITDFEEVAGKAQDYINAGKNKTELERLIVEKYGSVVDVSGADGKGDLKNE